MSSPVVELDDPGPEPLTVTAAAGLLEVLGKVADPRTRRGRRFGLAPILAVALAATLTGARSFTAIGEWAADTPAHLLARLGLSRGAPSEKTIRRTLQRLDADALDRAIGAWMWLRTKTIGGVKVISFDGKTLKGARDAAGKLAHLLSGICQTTGVIIGQVAVGDKTSEVPELRNLLAGLDIAGCVITADALHTCRETAEDIIAAGAHYIFVVKANQPLLRKQLKALPWNDIPTLDHSSGKLRHGRLETRTLKAAGIGSGIRFPGAVQALRIHRTRTVISKRRGKRKQTRETVYVVTSLDVIDASHDQIADWLRGHWAIENRVHWVRDTVFDEDRHQARTGTGPQVLATLRNTAISLLRLAGHTGIARTLRRNSRDPQRPIEMLLTC
jgi:predicted transposase YbfD/YdcC